MTRTLRKAIQITSVAVAVTFSLASSVAFGQDNKKLNSLEIDNFDDKGNQLIRYSRIGDAIDAHDGEIALFNGIYYLYGTSYDCGFEWQNKKAAFCGFKVYTSRDMVNWSDKGYLFDAKNNIWQTRCNGNTYGCFRPHVIYNKRTGKYVLWINVYDNISGYRVFTSPSPAGPFLEVAEPKLMVNASAPAGELNNGDHDLFVDDDGTAYIALTDWREGGRIMVEKLADDYLTGAGVVGAPVTEKRTEAPGMFKRLGKYYIVYSDPNCGYCSGTGASYKTAASPLGPWSEQKKISDNSCGGQPSFVSTIKLSSGNIFLFGSDLWNNAAKNEALANYFWTPLTFEKDGSIRPIDCDSRFKISGRKIQQDPAVHSRKGSVKGTIEIKQGNAVGQVFVAKQSSILKEVHIPLYAKGSPDSSLQLDLYAADANNRLSGPALITKKLTANQLRWSVKNQIVKLNTQVKKGRSYILVLSTRAGSGSFGYTYNVTEQNAPTSAFGLVQDSSIVVKAGQRLNFQSVYISGTIYR